MKINKQLFEDILSGKLKGTFIQKDGKKLNDNLLTNVYKFTVVLNGKTFYLNGVPTSSYYNGILDIVDFIPDTDMKENELTIEIPDGKIVDWDESKKQNKIVLKNKQLTYEDVCNKLQDTIDISLSAAPSKVGHVLVANVHQLECLLAKNMLANVAKYLNDGWKPAHDMQPKHLNEEMWVILSFMSGIYPVKVMQYSMLSCSGTILFKSKELARQAIKILGEETVKLALEPLGI